MFVDRLLWVVFLTIALDISYSVADPCQTYTLINDTTRSIAYTERIPENSCDSRRLSNGWYRFQENTNRLPPTFAPARDSCGTERPIWLDGSYPTHPLSVNNMTACTVGLDDSCTDSVIVQVKNCVSFHVLLLKTPVSCPARYCTDVINCSLNPCENGGTCIDLPSGDYKCSCFPGTSGTNCENHNGGEEALFRNLVQRSKTAQGSKDHGSRSKRGFRADDVLWPQGIVPYEINTTSFTDPLAIPVIQQAIERLKNTTCVQFLPHTPEVEKKVGHPNYVNFISVTGGGCSSLVGMHKVNQFIQLEQSGCLSVCLALHEMLHAIGQPHENRRTDRDYHVKVNLTLGPSHGKTFSRDYYPYDYESIMQGGFWEENKALQPELTFLTDNCDLSFYDIAEITTAYRCADKCVNPLKCQNGGFLNFKCECWCPYGLTGKTCEKIEKEQDCGGNIDLVSGQEVPITSPKFPKSYDTNTKCVWLIRAPEHLRVRVDVDVFHLPVKDNTNDCYHWLEVRYNLVGQTGIRKCGMVSGDIWVTTPWGEQNLMILIFDSVIGKAHHAEKGFSLRARTVNKGCIPNPCIKGVCKDCDDGSFSCKCDPGFEGRFCDTLEASGTFECTFESDRSNWCFMRNVQGDDFDWTVNSGETASDLTGPYAAHRGENYIYVEGSFPRKPKDKAVLESDLNFPAGAYCLTFYYNMFGADMGSLTVVLNDFNGDHTLWTRSGNQGSDWIQGQVEIPSAENAKVRFEAKRGSSWESDIALDDINISPGPCALPLGVDHEEVVQPDASLHFKEWREGRRIVELGVLADGLKACTECGLPLQLGHTTSIQNFGLSAILKIPCFNTMCRHTNNVPTGKRQDRVWDANVKLAAATLNAGLGERQVNTFLSGLNIPPVSHTMISSRQKDVGVALQELAKETTDRALNEEIELTKKNKRIEKLTVSVDAGWQKRGSGRSYDSLSGHCSMIGSETGKVLNYAVRQKTCRICSIAIKSKCTPPDHECHKNWTGSAKGMEADMVTEMVKDVEKEGASVGAIVGDEDSTTIARLRANVNKNIEKVSDSNHIKKLLGNSLYDIKKQHKTLTVKVIQYIQRCFNFVTAQGKGNPDQIKRSILGLSGHLFGKHTGCDKSWCKFLENPDEKYSSLPHGKPLSDTALQKSLTCMFSLYAENAEKLSSLGSTQANESFNRIVASKAPKSQHYSSSGSLKYRIAASVAQKNVGNTFMLDVNRRMSLSPGYFTESLAKLRDHKHKKRKATSQTHQFKQKRRSLKSARQQKLATSEVREGATYASGINFEEQKTDNIEEIPAPVLQPAYDVVEWNTDVNEIFFDIEATGLEKPKQLNCMLTAKGTDYTGTINITKGGLKCQRWDSDSPHKHTFHENNKEENFCRNTRGDENSPWCYTTSSLRWDVCTVPYCDVEECIRSKNGYEYLGSKSTTAQGKTCVTRSDGTNACRGSSDVPAPYCYTVEGDPIWDTCVLPRCTTEPKECLKTLKGIDYFGKVNKTKSGITCQAWARQEPHQHGFWAMDDQDNYCRNPDGQPAPWCFTTDPDKKSESCDIPYCQDLACLSNPCLHNGKCEEMIGGFKCTCQLGYAGKTCETRERDIADCRRSKIGYEYRGKINTTVSNRTCQMWKLNKPHAHRYNTIDGENYCRNPDGEPDGPWCYTTDPNKRWEYCDIPYCSTPAKECLESHNGLEYFGSMNHTVGGFTCQKWGDQFPHKHEFGGLADQGNYCRNTGSKTLPWCFIIEQGKTWEYCAIPPC